MPGDDLVPRPLMNATRAVTIDAGTDDVWPWLAQMGGYTRAGWYSFDHIDNAGRPSATRIIPELQRIKVGDTMATGPDGSGFIVESVHPGRHLVLVIRSRGVTISSTFLLERAGAGRTRLINRLRLRPGRDPLGALFWLAMDTGDILFMARTLLGIKQRAEGGTGRTAELPGQDPRRHTPTGPGLRAGCGEGAVPAREPTVVPNS